MKIGEHVTMYGIEVVAMPELLPFNGKHLCTHCFTENQSKTCTEIPSCMIKTDEPGRRIPIVWVPVNKLNEYTADAVARRLS